MLVVVAVLVHVVVVAAYSSCWRNTHTLTHTHTHTRARARARTHTHTHSLTPSNTHKHAWHFWHGAAARTYTGCSSNEQQGAHVAEDGWRSAHVALRSVNVS